MAWASVYNHLPSSHFTFWTEMDAPVMEKGWKLDLQHLQLCNESECLSVQKRSHELGFYFWWAMIGQVYQSQTHTKMLMGQTSNAKVKSLIFHPFVFKCTFKNKVVTKNLAPPHSSRLNFDNYDWLILVYLVKMYHCCQIVPILNSCDAQSSSLTFNRRNMAGNSAP